MRISDWAQQGEDAEALKPASIFNKLRNVEVGKTIPLAQCTHFIDVEQNVTMRQLFAVMREKGLIVNTYGTAKLKAPISWDADESTPEEFLQHIVTEHGTCDLETADGLALFIKNILQTQFHDSKRNYGMKHDKAVVSQVVGRLTDIIRDEWPLKQPSSARYLPEPHGRMFEYLYPILGNSDPEIGRLDEWTSVSSMAGRWSSAVLNELLEHPVIRTLQAKRDLEQYPSFRRKNGLQELSTKESNS